MTAGKHSGKEARLRPLAENRPPHDWLLPAPCGSSVTGLAPHDAFLFTLLSHQIFPFLIQHSIPPPLSVHTLLLYHFSLLPGLNHKLSIQNGFRTGYVRISAVDWPLSVQIATPSSWSLNRRIAPDTPWKSESVTAMEPPAMS